MQAERVVAMRNPAAQLQGQEQEVKAVLTINKNSLSIFLAVVHMSVAVAALADTAEDEATIRTMVVDLWKQVAQKAVDAADINPGGCALATSAGGFWQYLNPEEFASLINDAPNTLNFEASYIEVQFLGSEKDVAYVTYYLSGTIQQAEGSVTDYRTRASNLMEKIDGRWLMTGSHYSPLFGGSGVRFR